MPEIILENFFLSEAQDSPLVSSTNTLTKMVGCNAHRRLGVVGTSEEAVQINDTLTEVKAIVPVDEEHVYIFSSNNIIKHNVFTSTFTPIHTIVPVGTINAEYFDGYVYYSTGNKLGRFRAITDDMIDDSFGTFNNNVPSEQKPMFVLDQNLYIGDQDLVALVDSFGAFTPDALDVDKDFKVTALGNIRNELVIGTAPKNNWSYCKVFRWNTWSASFTNESIVESDRINNFYSDDGKLYFIAGGRNLKVYQYSEPFSPEVLRIPSNTTGWFQQESEGIILPSAQAIFNNRAYFGLSNLINGGDYDSGIYTATSAKRGFPLMVSMDYIPTPGNFFKTQITAMGALRDNLFFAWHDVTTGDWGIDKITLGKDPRVNDAFIETNWISLDRLNNKDFSVYITYANPYVPGMDVSLVIDRNYSDNNESFYEVRHDADRKYFYTQADVAGAHSVKFRVNIQNANSIVPLQIEKIIIKFI